MRIPCRDAQDPQWISHVELTAAAHFFNVNLAIVQKDTWELLSYHSSTLEDGTVRSTASNDNFDDNVAGVVDVGGVGLDVGLLAGLAAMPVNEIEALAALPVYTSIAATGGTVTATVAEAGAESNTGTCGCVAAAGTAAVAEADTSISSAGAAATASACGDAAADSAVAAPRTIFLVECNLHFNHRSP